MSLKLIALLFVPLQIIARPIFSLVLVNLYKLYLLLKKPLAGYWRPAKNRILFPFSTRYAVHGMLILATLFVATNSIKAREIRQEDITQPTILSGILKTETDTEIVETNNLTNKTSNRYAGVGGVSPQDMGGTTATDADFDLAATQDQSSLLKQDIAGTDSAGTPRSDVVYHIVEGGETVSTIAQAYHVSINTILWENKLGDSTYIQPGQKLTILPTTGISYRVQSGDTISSIAQKFGGDTQQVVDFNKLANDSAISQDEVLIIPGGRPVAPPAPVPTTRLASLETTQPSASDYIGTPQNLPAPQPGAGLFWPTDSHKINQYYNPYRHPGIDIDNGRFDAPIFAAQAGRVETAGWGGGYGLYVVINHGNGMETVYGHSSRLLVKAGQQVQRGQVIGIQGCTGRCTGEHLHFEVHIGGRRVNPFSYL